MCYLSPPAKYAPPCLNLNLHNFAPTTIERPRNDQISVGRSRLKQSTKTSLEDNTVCPFQRRCRECNRADYDCNRADYSRVSMPIFMQPKTNACTRRGPMGSHTHFCDYDIGKQHCLQKAASPGPSVGRRHAAVTSKVKSFGARNDTLPPIKVNDDHCPKSEAQTALPVGVPY